MFVKLFSTIAISTLLFAKTPVASAMNLPGGMTWNRGLQAYELVTRCLSPRELRDRGLLNWSNNQLDIAAVIRFVESEPNSIPGLTGRSQAVSHRTCYMMNGDLGYQLIQIRAE